MRRSNIYVFAALLVLKFSPLCAQQFSALGIGFSTEVRTIFADSASGKVYVGGFFTQYSNGDSIRKIAVWNGANWDSLGSGINDGGVCLSIQKFNNEIFFGGSFNYIAGNNFRGLAKWDGLNWSTIGNVLSFSPNGGVNKIIVLGSDMFVVGTVASVNGVYANKIARWDGINWHTFPVLDSIGYNLMAAAIYNNELYVGGQFTASPQMQDIAKFDGTNWVPVLNGLSGIGWVGDMVVYQNELYVSGSFQTQYGDPGNGILKWNGTSWDDLGGGTDAAVYQMKVINNELYIAGAFNLVSGVPASKIAKWDGSQWHSLGSNINSVIYSLSAIGGDIYIAGHFTSIDGVSMNRVAKYTVPTSINEFYHFKNAIKVHPTLTTGLVTIEVERGELHKIFVYDITGKQIMAENYIENEQTINLSNHPPGVYIIKVETIFGAVNRKVVLIKED